MCKENFNDCCETADSWVAVLKGCCDESEALTAAIVEMKDSESPQVVNRVRKMIKDPRILEHL